MRGRIGHILNDAELKDKLLLNSIRNNNGCLIWSRGITGSGYGMIWDGIKNYLCHRKSWELFKGPIENGESVLHRCDTPACINVDHLFLGTQLDNMHDMQNKGRKVIVSGIELYRKRIKSLLNRKGYHLIKFKLSDGTIKKKFQVVVQFDGKHVFSKVCKK